MGFKKITVWSGILGALLFAFASIWGGLQIEGYSPIGQYISESYATGMPNAKKLQYAFMASGILLAVFGFSAPSFFPKSKGIKNRIFSFGNFLWPRYFLGGIFSL